MRPAIAIVATACIVATQIAPTPGHAFDPVKEMFPGLAKPGRQQQQDRVPPAKVLPSPQPTKFEEEVRRRIQELQTQQPPYTLPTYTPPTYTPAAVSNPQSSSVFADLPPRPAGYGGFDRLPWRDPPPPGPIAPSPAPWQLDPSGAGAIGTGLDDAITIFQKRAQEFGLQDSRLTQSSDIRTLAVTAFETSRLKLLSAQGDGPWSEQLLQSMIVAGAAELLPEFSRALASGSSSADQAIASLFDRASYDAWMSAVSLNEAAGLSESIDRYNQAVARRFNNSPRFSTGQTSPKIVAAVAASSLAIDSQIDREGLGVNAKLRLRRLLFDCATDRVSSAVQSASAMGQALTAGAIEEVVSRDVSLGCRSAAANHFSNPGVDLTPLPIGAVWTEQGFLDRRRL
jgi:hypothetical protein